MKQKDNPIRFFMCLITLVGGMYIISELQKNGYILNDSALVHHSQQPNVTGPTINHAFKLLDVNGETKTPRHFPGRFHLMYFGYTACPDVCPASLGKMAEILDEIDPELQSRITPFFVSIDPDQDSPAQLKAYMEHFDSRIVALTPADKEDLDKLITNYRLVVQQQSSINKNERLIDHTSLLYLFNPQGGLITFFGPDQNPTAIANTISNSMLEGK